MRRPTMRHVPSCTSCEPTRYDTNRLIMIAFIRGVEMMIHVHSVRCPFPLIFTFTLMARPEKGSAKGNVPSHDLTGAGPPIGRAPVDVDRKHGHGKLAHQTTTVWALSSARYNWRIHKAQLLTYFVNLAGTTVWSAWIAKAKDSLASLGDCQTENSRAGI
ncbi:hypothetical protein IE81DRAFT_224115 [Ceraceosorus guamensis]|uniref:Uncharacterized protein n=1 Tax=Ceraceosorus guamensis TaxID=1522189 RepID=A0A316W579_9BASI|nr:hypothetical protein IE81DRAFT_224115 [Ceraceosorus guamensis]PWN44969.1 hypothetical protein IE81DRAFT_224115 [Ceraceosorus guamensis]